VLPSKKVTVPVAALGETVAVNFTPVPYVDGFAEEATPVVVLVRNVAVAAKSPFPFADAAQVLCPVHSPVPLHPENVLVPGFATSVAL